MSQHTETAVAPSKKNGNGNGHHLVAQDPAPSDFLMRIAADPAIDADKLKLMAETYITMQERQRQWIREDNAERARVAYLDAKAKMQADLPVVEKLADNPHTRSKYADFGAMWELCCPIWTKYGFSVSFQADAVADGLIRVSCLLDHAEGHREIYSAPPSPPDTAGMRGTTNKTVPQGNQATTTFLQRGLLCRAIGIAMKGEETDGNDAATDTGYRPHTTATPAKNAPPPPAQPVKPIRQWVQAAVGKLNAMLSKDFWQWKSMVIQAAERVPSLDDLDELEAVLTPDIDHKDTPHDVRTELKSAMMLARKRLTPAAKKFEAMLFDAFGEELDGEIHTDATRFARAFLELHAATFPADVENLMTHNADGLTAARTFPGAAKLLSSLEQNGSDSGATGPTTAGMVHGPVEPPMNNGKRVWSVWINLFRDELSTIPREELHAWGMAQEPVLSLTYKEGMAQRTMARKALAEAIARPDSEAAASGQGEGVRRGSSLLDDMRTGRTVDHDLNWVADLKNMLDAIPTTIIGRGQFERLMYSEETEQTMSRLREERPDVFDKAKAAIFAKDAELPKEPAR